jgi:hypothetical protein
MLRNDKNHLPIGYEIAAAADRGAYSFALNHNLYGLAFIALLGFNACNNEEIETLGDPASIEKGNITFALPDRAHIVTTYGETIQTADEYLKQATWEYNTS